MSKDKSVSVASSESIFNSMATQQFNYDLLALIKSSQPLIYITTQEENRFRAYMHHLSIASKRMCFLWDTYKGLVNILDPGEKVEVAGNDDKDPDAVLDIIIDKIEKFSKECDDNTKGCIYILFGFDRFISPACDPETERRLKYISSISNRVTVILVGPSYVSTPSLDKDMALLDFPYPNDEEIKNTLYHVLDSATMAFPNASKRVKEHEEELIKACRGLTLVETQQAYCKSVVMAKKTKKPEFDIQTILNEKKQIIKKNPILEYIESDISIKDVGGLDEFTDWLKKRKMAFQSDASQYGLPYPKGVLMVGIPGGGKSLSAKATAGYYEMPLLRLDFGKMFGSLVGESERTSREAIKMAESLAPCVGGSSVIISSDGKSYTIKDILNNEDLLNNLYIYALNEKNLKTERTKVKAVIKHLEQKEMLKIKTPIGSIDATRDHKILVNKNGTFEWVAASEIKVGDFICTSRKINRDLISFDILDSEKDIIIIEDESVGFNTYALYYLLGMIQSSGSINTKNGCIVYDTFDWSLMYIFCNTFASIFNVEPEVSSGQCVINNSKLSYLFDRARKMLFTQDDAILLGYLSGFIDSAGLFTNDNSSISLECFTYNDDHIEELYKIYHMLGICLPRYNKNTFCVKGISNIKDVCLSLDLHRKDLSEFIEMAILCNEKEDYNFDFGLKMNKQFSNFIKSNDSDSQIITFELIKNNKNESIIGKYLLSILDDGKMESNNGYVINLGISEDTKKVINSDLIGVRVVSINDIGLQDTYDLSCESNSNFFANNILCHNCILWCDEVEKGLSGTASSGSTDGGTTSRVVSTFLTWLQEKESPVFVFCTANNPLQIPPEFMRAGRFDEVFFVDLPNQLGREQILEIQIKKKGRDPKKFNIPKIASLSQNYSGAEIEKAVEIALFEAYADSKREIETKDIINAIKSFKPLSETRKEDIDFMKEWADGRCKVANTKESDVKAESIIHNKGLSNKSVDVDF